MGKYALKKIPNLYSNGVSKIKNKKIKFILDSNIPNYLVDQGTGYTQ